MMDSSHVSLKRRGGSARQLRSIILTIIVLAVVLGGLFWWRGLRSAPTQGWAQEALPVAAMVVRAQDVPASLEAVGTLRAVQQVRLSPEVAGRVSEIHFEAGQQVEAGTLLVQVFDGPEQADRQAAEAKEAFAKVQFDRSKRLASTGAEPKELLEQNRSLYDQAVAAVHQLDARILQKQVRAPFAGEIGIRQINLGQYLNPGDEVATLTALDALYVDFALPQQDFSHLKVGARVEVTSDAWPRRTFTGQVHAVEPRIDEETRNITVRATLDNPDHALRPGMYVTASLVLPPQEDAIVVPVTAIQTSAQGDSVIVVRGEDAASGGTAEIIPVQTGRRVGNDVVVTGGLKPGDVVVTEGQVRVQPGASVTVVPSGQAGEE
jgi:multidrug efflux system membrane fusion protein